jgi:antitoxin HigA-1
MNHMRPVHPGEVLREEFLAELNIDAYELSKVLALPATNIDEILQGRRSITVEIAERLVRHFGGDVASWLALQTDFDLKNSHAGTERY